MNYHIIYKKVKNGYARIQTDGSVLITIPKFLRYNKKFEAQLIEQAQKLLQRQEKRKQIISCTETHLQLFGESVMLTEIDTSILKKTSKKDVYELFCEQTLLDYLHPEVDKYSSELGFEYRSIKVKRLKSKWWSCSHDQRLVFNLDLIHLPTNIIQYVIIHEICHLKEKNHSINFRKLVESFLPQYKNIRKSLKQLVVVHPVKKKSF